MRVLGSKMVYRLYSKQLVSSPERLISSIQSDLQAAQTAFRRPRRLIGSIQSDLLSTQAVCRFLSKPQGCFTVTLSAFKRAMGLFKAACKLAGMAYRLHSKRLAKHSSDLQALKRVAGLFHGDFVVFQASRGLFKVTCKLTGVACRLFNELQTTSKRLVGS